MPIIKKKTKPLKPARMLVLSFFCAIMAGSLLLWLPISSNSGVSVGFIDSLFTATSATCVTGLSVFDTYTQFNYFGQTVIMLLIQIGGLGLVTLVTFFNLAIGKKIGLIKQNNAADDIGSSNGLVGTKQLFIRIICFSFAFETAGAVILMFTFVPQFGAYGVFISFFLAISSFCNAGFDVLGIIEPGNGLVHYTDSPQVLIPLILLIVIGGIGFVVWEDFASYHKTKHFTIHTKLVLISTGTLLLLGALVYFIVSLMEPEKFGDMYPGERVMCSFFASASARTAGFTAADLPLANEFSRLCTMGLMFVGAAPGSTAGGIKITTLAILIMTIISVIKGREDAQVFGHLVPKKVVYKTMTVFALSIGFVLIAFTSLYLLNPELPVMDILYEVVSAFSTTGLSCGVSAQLGIASKIILCLTMFAGRVGPVSLFLSLTQDKSLDKNKIMPVSNIMIG